jgi:hypothetical protein
MRPGDAESRPATASQEARWPQSWEVLAQGVPNWTHISYNWRRRNTVAEVGAPGATALEVRHCGLQQKLGRK